MNINVKIEYSVFKHKMLSSCSRIIYDSCSIIRFYECMHEYFEYNENISSKVIKLLEDKKDLIASLYQFYLKHEELEIGTWDHIDTLLEMYISYNKRI